MRICWKKYRVRIDGTEKAKESPLLKHTSKAKAIYNLLYCSILFIKI
jgi:hypothetical protein